MLVLSVSSSRQQSQGACTWKAYIRTAGRVGPSCHRWRRPVMSGHDAVLEPFNPDVLRAIQTAFRIGWHELCSREPVPNPIELRNRLAGTIALLARNGIT